MKIVRTYNHYFVLALATFIFVPQCNAQSESTVNKQEMILGHPANEVGDFGNKPKASSPRLIDPQPTTAVGTAVRGRLIKNEEDKQIDYGPYMVELQRNMKDLQRSIKQHWFPPKGDENKKVMVEFKVHSDGQLSNLHLLESSGVKAADDAALKAVEDAAPFKLLHPISKEKPVDVKFTFDYNTFHCTDFNPSH